jgi:hypothetical protein
MSTGTFSQATRALKLIGQQELNAEQLEILVEGYLTDLVVSIKKGDIPPRDTFRKLIGLPLAEFITAIDLNMTLEAMIEAGKYVSVNDFITADRFPIKENRAKCLRNKLFHLSRKVSSGDVAVAMKTANFIPADHVHGLAFGAKFPEEQCKYPIACLGSSARVDEDRYIVCLDKYRTGRCLQLYDCGGDWDEDFRFLGVQEISDA